MTAILGGRDVDGVRKGVITLHFRVMSKYRQFSSQSTRATDGQADRLTDRQNFDRHTSGVACAARYILGYTLEQAKFFLLMYFHLDL